jgi:hypothetical protein
MTRSLTFNWRWRIQRRNQAECVFITDLRTGLHYHLEWLQGCAPQGSCEVLICEARLCGSGSKRVKFHVFREDVQANQNVFYTCSSSHVSNAWLCGQMRSHFHIRTPVWVLGNMVESCYVSYRGFAIERLAYLCLHPVMGQVGRTSGFLGSQCWVSENCS